MNENCIFCRIISDEAQGEILYQDEQVTAFRDARPSAPVHVLVVPNRHIASIRDLQPADEPLIGHLFTIANKVAASEGLAGSGYRLVINQGADRGQTVFHIHLHVIGGRLLGRMAG